MWALGVVLWQLLVGWFPFGGRTQQEIINKIMRAEKRVPEKLKEPSIA